VDADIQAERLAHVPTGSSSSQPPSSPSEITSTTPVQRLLCSSGPQCSCSPTPTARRWPRAVGGHALGTAGRRLVALNDLPVFFAIAVPMLLFVLAGLEAISLTTAYCLDRIVQSGSVIEARSEGLDPQPCGPWISDL